MPSTKRITVDNLPAEPLSAADVFHQHWLPRVRALLAEGSHVMIALPAADHTHREWRHAITAGLAREYAPMRVNAVAAEGGMLDAFERYLAAAPGVTGQYMAGDATGAGNPMDGSA